jgi:hypothetical protein
LASRYVDPAKSLGNLEPGEMLFRPAPVEVIPMTPYSADELIAAHRAHHRGRGSAPAPFRSAPYRHRSLRRGV